MTAAITALVQQFEHGIRRIVVSGVTYYSLVDMCAVLTDTKDANIYWRDTKRRLKKDGFESWENIPQFKLPAADGKYRLTDCATAETCLRIVQAIPSPKAEPLRRWFARVAIERIEETANPELGIARSRQRAVEAYQERGLPADWIAARLKGIGERNHFTDSIARNVRGMEGEDYAEATNAIYQGLWGRSARELRREMGLSDRANLRDHQPRLAAQHQAIVEAAVSEMLSRIPDPTPDELCRICRDIARTVGLQADDLSAYMGIDLATGRRLLRR